MARATTQKLIALCGLVLWSGAPLSSIRADEVSGVSSSHSLRLLKTVKTPKPPYPTWILHGKIGERPTAHLVVVHIAIDHGKVVQAIPVSDNAALGNYVADWIQKKWIFTPEMTGTFKLPIYFND